MKKLLISLLSVIIISICAAFNVPARSSPKPVSLKLKSECAAAHTQKAQSVSNFHRADSLVMYEMAQVDSFSVAGRLSFLKTDEDFHIKSWHTSRYFYAKPQFNRKSLSQFLLMIFNSDHELTIRRAISEKTALVPAAGFVVPSPIFYKDKADFWAQINSLAVNTKDAIEQTNIAFCCISLLKRVDSVNEGCSDSPLIRLTYNFHFFRGYDCEREDERDVPDDFLKRTLKTYNLFVKAVMDVWTEFLGVQNIPELPTGIEGNTNSLTQPDFIEEKRTCRYIPGIEGHSVNLQSVIEVTIQDES